MVKTTSKLGSAKRYGPRYGSSIRNQVSLVENMRSDVKCPYCHNVKIKRIASGIWYCTKCNVKFTSKAYSVEEAPKITDLEEMYEEVSSSEEDVKEEKEKTLEE